MAEGRRDAIASGWRASNVNERVPLTDACDLTIPLPGASSEIQGPSRFQLSP